MKRFLICLFVMLAAVACNSEYDDTAVWDSIKSLEQRTQAMESVLNALKNKLTVTSVRTTSDGFIITFSDGTSAVVTNGEDGKDGVLNVVNGEVPPTVDLRIIYLGQASNYSIKCLMPYTPPAF